MTMTLDGSALGARGQRTDPVPWRVEAVGSAVLVLVGLGIATAAAGLRTRDAQLPALRMLAVVVLAFIPGWLYIRFSTYRAAAVWEEYVLYLHRLRFDDPANLPEPLLSSTYHDDWQERRQGAPADDGTNIYKQKFEAYYGKGTARSVTDTPPRLRARADTLLPVLMTTAILGVGWAAVLLGPSFSSKHFTTADALRFGFMGAYSFVLQMLVRRFFQSDLRPSAYITATVRVLTVLILVAVVFQATGGMGPAAGAATVFIIGFFPLLGMQAIQRVAAKALRTTVKSLDAPYPLSDLDGLNVWNEARLLEVGVEDMQNLVTANLVDIMLHTRVPMGRIVDWIDQAHLFLHLEQCQCETAADKKTCSRTILRRYGIRTATDLEDAFRRSQPESDGCGALGAVHLTDEDENALVEALRWVLNESTSKPSVTQAMLKTFEAEPNLDHVRCWKRSWRTGDERPRSSTSAVPEASAA